MYSESSGPIFQFPDPLVDPKKINDAYCIQYAQAMFNTFNKSGYSIFYNARAEYAENARYALGNQSVNQYKQWLNFVESNLENTTNVNLDFRILNFATKYINIVQDKLAKELFQITCTPIDALAVDQKRDYRARVEALKEMQLWMEQQQIMVTKDFAGVDAPPIDMNSDELEIFYSMSLKHRWAMSMEILIETILNMNDYEQIKKDIAWDLIVCGVGAVKITERDDQVPYIEKVKPGNLILSNAKNDKFSDLVYAGEVKTMTINEFFRRAGDKFNKEQQEDIIHKFSRNIPSMPNEAYLGTPLYGSFNNNTPMIEVLDFVFEAPAAMTYEKKTDRYGNKKLSRKDAQFPTYGEDEYKKRYGKERELIKSKYQTLYKGLWVIGSTDYICDVGPMKNIVRDKKTYEPYFPYVIMAPNMKDGMVTSMVKQMIPVLNNIQNNWLRHNEVIAKAIPKGAAIDLDALENVSLGKGGVTMSPKEILDLFYKRGIYPYRSRDMKGQGMNGIPITELANGISADAMQYLTNIANGINMLRDITGLNELVDGSTPDPKQLKSVAQAAMQGSNSALAPLYFGSKSIFERMCKMISMCVPAAIKRGAIAPLDDAIGEPTVKFFGENSDISAHSWAIKIEAKPGRDDWESLYQDMGVAIEQGQITIADTIFIREIDNLKQARQYLILAVKRNQEQKMQEQQASSEANAQAQMQSNQQAEDAKRQTLQFEHQMNIELEKLKQETIILQEEEKRKTILAQAASQSDAKVQVAEIQASSNEQQAAVKAQAQIQAAGIKKEVSNSTKK